MLDMWLLGWGGVAGTQAYLDSKSKPDPQAESRGTSALLTKAYACQIVLGKYLHLWAA